MALPMSGVEGITLPTGLAEMSATGLLITLVAAVLLSFFRGWIIPKIHYDTAIKRAETAESAVATLTATNAVQAQTIEKQTAVGETVVRVMNSVQEARATAGDTT
jgi:hypothetical protein